MSREDLDWSVPVPDLNSELRGILHDMLQKQDDDLQKLVHDKLLLLEAFAETKTEIMGMTMVVSQAAVLSTTRIMAKVIDILYENAFGQKIKTGPVEMLLIQSYLLGGGCSLDEARNCARRDMKRRQQK